MDVDKYLFVGNLNIGDSIEYCFLTFQLGFDIIVPYFSFRNLYYDLSDDMSMYILTKDNRNASRIINVDVVKNENEIKIIIYYDEIETIELVFDGKIFVGDYQKIIEVIGGP